jgi:hypothetical protein
VDHCAKDEEGALGSHREDHTGVGTDAREWTVRELEGGDTGQCGTQFVQLLVRQWVGQRLAQTDVGVADGGGLGALASSEFIDGGGDVGGRKEIEGPVPVLVLPRFPDWLEVVRHNRLLGRHPVWRSVALEE